MQFLFDDESFSFETLRAAGFAAYGGAELGEVLVTAAAITGGDEASWHRAWKATAERVQEIGEQARAAGHRVSAREALLRASNYYRAAEFYLRENPASHPEVTALSAQARETFAAASLLDTPAETVSIPYEGTTLPGYLFLADDSGTPRPAVTMSTGTTPPRRSPGSRWPRPRCAAGTTSWPSTAPGRARRCASRSWCSVPTGRPSSPRSSTTRSPGPRSTPGRSRCSATAWAATSSPGPRPSTTAWPP